MYIQCFIRSHINTCLIVVNVQTLKVENNNPNFSKILSRLKLDHDDTNNNPLLDKVTLLDIYKKSISNK